MYRTWNANRRTAGAALLTALGLLFVFSLLGAAYVGYMSNALDRSTLDIRFLRARTMARGGVQAAIGEIQSALRDPEKMGQLLNTSFEIEIPSYMIDKEAAVGFSANTARRGVCKAGIADESGKINLNHAPVRALRAILNCDGDTARKIRSSLPGGGSPASIPEANGAQRWLASPDDVVTRGLMSAAAFDAVPKRFITVYSVADHANPSGFINVNTAPPEVLAAILDITPEAARAVAAKRSDQPFQNLAELGAAAGKDPATFNFKPPPDAPSAPPCELSLQSRCFRVVSRAVLSDLGPNNREIRPTHARAEAVVIFDERGAPEVMYWSESPEREPKAEK